MLRNYFKTAFRNLWRYGTYSLINISGLAIGMATCILIFIYITHELSYDKFLDDHEDLYRVCMNGRISDDYFNVAVTMPALALPLKSDFPEIRNVCRVDGAGSNFFFANGENKFYESDVYFVDSTFLEMFSFHMLEGSPTTALREPLNVVLTRSAARKFFGDEDAMGKVLRVNDKDNLKVTGILEDIPDNSHMKFNMLISLETAKQWAKAQNSQEGYDDNWGSLNIHTYVQLKPGVNIQDLNKKMDEAVRKNMGDLAALGSIEFVPYLQPVEDIHLRSHLMAELGSNSDMNYIYTFAAIALFILVIACINFMNLSTARSIKRSREVGLRKVCGASRGQLIRQFLGESLLLSLGGIVFALFFVELVMPVFSDLTGLHLEMHLLEGYNLVFLLALVVVVGILAGSYPAFVLSSFRPIRVIKGEAFKSRKKPLMRNVLVVLQFTISIILLISTILIYEQLGYLRHKNLGFDQEHLMVIPLRGERLKQKAEYFKQQFKSLSFVAQASISNGTPNRQLSGIGFVPEGIDSKSPWIIYTMSGDQDFVPTMGMQIVQGRNFDPSMGTDSMAVLINQTLVKKLGWKEPIGKKIFSFGNDSATAYHIIGILKDYNFKPLTDPVEPAMITMGRQNPNYLSLRLQPGNVNSQISQIRDKWEEMEQAFPFDYSFMAEDMKKEQASEARMGTLFIYFTILAIFIACLGLFGLAAYSAEQRTKEIGIRKVLGASVTGLVMKLGREFSKWVLLANVIAWPLVYYLVYRWLQTFAYRIEIVDYLWVFVLSGLAALFIAVVTVSYKALQAASTDPVKALKYE